MKHSLLRSKQVLLLVLLYGGSHVVHSWTTTTTPSTTKQIPFLSSTSLAAASTCCPEAPEIATATSSKHPNYQTFFTPKHTTTIAAPPPPLSPASSSPWDALVPLLPNSRGCDVKLVWHDPREGVDELLLRLQNDAGLSAAQISLLRPPLLASFRTFSRLIVHNNNNSSSSSHQNKQYRARVVATRGSTGTKCPRWHADHVPLRWIQAFVGPGCDYVVGEDGLRRDLLNAVDSTDNANNNRLLVNDRVADIRQGRTGEAVVLVGSDNKEGIAACVHKSPSLMPWQGRVLMTLDVVPED